MFEIQWTNKKKLHLKNSIIIEKTVAGINVWLKFRLSSLLSEFNSFQPSQLEQRVFFSRENMEESKGGKKKETRHKAYLENRMKRVFARFSKLHHN